MTHLVYTIKDQVKPYLFMISTRSLSLSKLLSIVKTLKGFFTNLLVQRLKIYTDHKNLTCKNFNTDRVLRWRLILEEYGPYIEYIKVEKNIAADALSR